jgi:hypothetical protein
MECSKLVEKYLSYLHPQFEWKFCGLGVPGLPSIQVSSLTYQFVSSLEQINSVFLVGQVTALPSSVHGLRPYGPMDFLLPFQSLLVTKLNERHKDVNKMCDWFEDERRLI